MMLVRLLGPLEVDVGNGPVRGPARARVYVDDVEVPHCHRPLRRIELELRQLEADEVVGGSVILGYREIRGQGVDVVAQAAPQTSSATRAYVSAVLTSPSISRFSPSSTSIRPVDAP